MQIYVSAITIQAFHISPGSRWRVEVYRAWMYGLSEMLLQYAWKSCASMLAHSVTSRDTCCRIRITRLYTCIWSWQCQLKI